MLRRSSSLVLVAMIVSAQQRVSIRTGPSPVRSHPPAFSGGLPPIAPIPPIGLQRGLAPHTPGLFDGSPHRFGSPYKRSFRPVSPPFGLPLYVAPAEPYPSMPTVVIVLQPQASAPQKAERSRKATKPVIREYDFSAQPDDGATLFSIVLADGSQRSAMAVWRQDEWLHYVAPGGARRRVLIKLVDREATVLLNREKGLNLSW